MSASTLSALSMEAIFRWSLSEGAISFASSTSSVTVMHMMCSDLR